MDDTLKPCPFCGSGAYWDTDHNDKPCINCIRCPIRMCGFEHEDIRENWNRRTE